VIEPLFEASFRPGSSWAPRDGATLRTSAMIASRVSSRLWERVGRTEARSTTGAERRGAWEVAPQQLLVRKFCKSIGLLDRGAGPCSIRSHQKAASFVSERKRGVMARGPLGHFGLCGALAVGVLLGLTSGCARKEPPPTLSGTFRETSVGGGTTVVTFSQEGNAIVGGGIIGGRRFAASGLATWSGSLVFTFEDGAIASRRVTLSPDGASILGLGTHLTLERGGEPMRLTPGTFSGKFRSPGPPALSLTLTQGGELLSGIGYVDGKPLAVVGRVTGPGSVVGSILYSDESRSSVRATLSSNGRTLTVGGLGAPIELTRE